ncbi:MAG: cytochrome c4 [Kangiella sp.]|nr:MAG: cytochrome c4 [Kangiella sp.]
MRNIIGLTLIFLFSNIALAGDIAKGKAKSGVCAACHAADGNSAIAINPKLAGQSAKYLAKQLHDFKNGKRSNATMAPMAGLLNDEDIENVSAFYASQKVQHMAVEDKHIAIAEKLYLGGDADRDIPACIACHSATGEGMAAAGFPAVGGQHPAYTIATLKAFRSGDRANDANEIMRDVTAKMSDKQIEALAYYLAGLH